VAWTRAFWNDLEPFAGDSIYVNHISTEEPSRGELLLFPISLGSDRSRPRMTLTTSSG